MLTRRKFLAASATVLGAIAAGCVRGIAPSSPAVGEGLPHDPPGVRPFRAALFSDVHLQPAATKDAENNVKLANAVADFAAFTPDLWVVNGDIADHGVSAEHEALKKVMAGVAQPGRLLVTTGNHEFYDMQTTDDVSIRRFTDAFGLKVPYSSNVFGDLHFVMIADEQWKLAPDHKDWCWITPEQLHWFDHVLGQHRDKLTLVFMHQPLNETVTGSQGPNAFGATTSAKELYAILGRNPQVKLWFSGHTHRRLDMDGQVVQKDGVTYVSIGSTAYLLGQPRPAQGGGVTPAGGSEAVGAGSQAGASGQPQRAGGFGRDPGACQSRFLEIYPDKVIVRARDHQSRRWMAELEITVDRA